MCRSFVFALTVVCCALSSEAESADLPSKSQFRPVPMRPGDGPPLALVQRGEPFWLGDFDKDGNFLRYPQFPPNYAGIIAVRFVYAFDCTSGEALVYEHRSGRAIKGTMVKIPPPSDPAIMEKALRNSRHVVVPEIGSTVLDIKDVDLKNPDRFVWNMPELGPAYVAERIRKHGDRPAPKAPAPPAAGTPAGLEFIPFSQADHLGRKPPPGRPLKHARAIGNVVEFGHLSDEGEFVPDPDLPVVSRAGILSKVAYYPFAVPRYYTVPRPPWLIGPKIEGQKESDPEEVYEFRSGRLIKGMLQATGNFVPELGSKVLDFKEYVPNRQPRIYNLPGTLRPVEKK